MQKVTTSRTICASTTVGNLKWQIELSVQNYMYFNDKHDWQRLKNRQTRSKSHRFYVTLRHMLEMSSM